MQTFSELKKYLKQDATHLTKRKLAILGDSSTQFLSAALRATGIKDGFDLQIWESDFNQIQQQVFDANSELYNAQPDIIILFFSTHKLLLKYNKTNPNHQHEFAHKHLALIDDLIASIKQHSKATILYYNHPEINDSIFGNFANKTPNSFLFQIRKLNYELMELATTQANFFICDLATIQNTNGRINHFHPAVYINSDMVNHPDSAVSIAQQTLHIIGALNGRMKKCVILDLDNTMWGGIIGDDGMENIEIGHLGIGKAFSEFQEWIKKLKHRGIIVAVCSKNNEQIAKEPFEKHPDMVLRLEDIAVFVANWENKVDNIRHIQSILNIGFDSMVFLDDNAFERNMVRENIPGIAVPELPEDPAEYLEYLYQLNLFETNSISEEDGARTSLYQQEAKRVQLKQSFANEDDFLSSMEMKSEVAAFNKFNLPRVAQLIQRSNQFNLRTIRHTESELENMSNAASTFTYSFTLSDKFGQHGLIAAIILKQEQPDTLFIDTWLMSCRVLKRTMENFSLNTIAKDAISKGFHFLKGEYIPTAKNELVKNHFSNLGFQQMEEYWILDLKTFNPRKTFIQSNTI